MKEGSIIQVFRVNMSVDNVSGESVYDEERPEPGPGRVCVCDKAESFPESEKSLPVHDPCCECASVFLRL